MTGPEFRVALAAIGLSQREFASRFGVTPVSVSRWAGGKHPVPGWVPAALELLDQDHVIPSKTNQTP